MQKVEADYCLDIGDGRYHVACGDRWFLCKLTDGLYEVVTEVTDHPTIVGYLESFREEDEFEEECDGPDMEPDPDPELADEAEDRHYADH